MLLEICFASCRDPIGIHMACQRDLLRVCSNDLAFVALCSRSGAELPEIFEKIRIFYKNNDGYV